MNDSMSLTIKEIKEKLSRIETLEELHKHEANNDSRKGVINAIKSREKNILKQQALEEHYLSMNQYENNIMSSNRDALICGIDEVGRGPLAGPVVACAVILEKNHHYIGLDDSKKVSPNNRARLNQNLKENVYQYAYGIASSVEIDELNIYRATQLAMLRAINQLDVTPTHLLIDAMTLDIDIPQTSIIKGDAKSVSIAAASIMAKEYRDQYMRQLSKQFPEYGFDKNAGYGTKQHLKAIDQVGIINEHRQSFEPIKSMMK
ncbi:ribonuclease HII [Staphylococcus epidermidis M23864:W2(grey)]|nr:ribonuclease HII [Staphylococcus epidermidis M23864:W2(grey)]